MAQQMAGIHVAVHQPAAVQQLQNRKDLAQQRQHLRSPEALLTQQVVVGDAVLPVAKEPEVPIDLQQLTATGQLRMLQRLQLRPDSLEMGLGGRELQLANGHRQITGHHIHRAPEGSPQRIGPAQTLLQAVTLHQHCAGTAQGNQPH